MSSSSLKTELADHIYRYLCHEAQYSDLPEAARESLTAASECIEQAYKLNNNNNNNGEQHQQQQSVDSNIGSQSTANNILPDELLRIFTRHKEFLAQHQREPFLTSKQLHYSLSGESSSRDEKSDIRASNNQTTTPSIATLATSATTTPSATTVNTDSHNTSNPISSSSSNQNTPNLTTTGTQAFVSANSGANASGQNEQQQPQPQPQPTTKQHSQHTISQLPMTTRKKLSHLRAQIKRQASKAARSRLEKRSSVSGVASSSCSGGSSLGNGGHHHLGGLLGSSLDTNSLINSKQAGDGSNSRDNPGNQANSSSNDTSNAYLNNQSTSSPTVGPSGLGGSNQTEGSNPVGQSSGHHHNESSSTSGIKLSHLIPGNHHHSIGVSVHQKNFKQKLIALIKKFRTDGSDFDSEEQYREALERELMKATAGRGSRAIEELLEEEIEVEGESGSEPEDWDNISESSTPKPSLRPFFSSTTLDKI